MHSIKNQLLGTWQLIHSIELDADGLKLYPFGEDAIGYLMYDSCDKMAVQISRKIRKKMVSSKLFKTVDVTELIAIPKDYLAYFGRYEIDSQAGSIKHIVEGSLFPNLVGEVLVRKYSLFEDQLLLKPQDGTRREILWQKIKY